ncbi:MAG: terminase small subunit [Gemmatimonadaceae bacterium]
MSDPRPLTPKQARFVEEYLTDLNATQAAIRAGYSPKTAYAIGVENLRKPVIVTALEEAMRARSERTGVTADRVVEELARIGFSDMRLFSTWGPHGVTLTGSETLSEDAARCVAEVSQTISKDGGSIRFKLHDKVGALSKLGQHLGMFPDKHEHTGKDGDPIAHEIFVRFVQPSTPPSTPPSTRRLNP